MGKKGRSSFGDPHERFANNADPLQMYAKGQRTLLPEFENAQRHRMLWEEKRAFHTQYWRSKAKPKSWRKSGYKGIDQYVLEMSRRAIYELHGMCLSMRWGVGVRKVGAILFSTPFRFQDEMQTHSRWSTPGATSQERRILSTAIVDNFWKRPGFRLGLWLWCGRLCEHYERGWWDQMTEFASTITRGSWDKPPFETKQVIKQNQHYSILQTDRLISSILSFTTVPYLGPFIHFWGADGESQ